MIVCLIGLDNGLWIYFEVRLEAYFSILKHLFTLIFLGGKKYNINVFLLYYTFYQCASGTCLESV